MLKGTSLFALLHLDCNIIVGDIRDCANPITVASDGSFKVTINAFDALAFVAA
jgi:hypothetical protein